MASAFESQMMLRMAEPLVEYARHLEPLFPHMEWNLKRSGYTIETAQYLSIALYMTTAVLLICATVAVVPVVYKQGVGNSYPNILFTIIATLITLGYILLMPSVKMHKRSVLIDIDLEFMLKDMQIQLSAGVPLFDTIVNIAKGEYGECSKICESIIQEVEQGKSITDVLDDVGMWSPSEYLRKTLWQMVNALKSGSDIGDALEVISSDIRLEKENKIKAYGKELNLYGLIYLMLAVIVPSMGVTLLVILSSFLGKGIITESVFYMIMLGLAVFQLMFIFFVRTKRPVI
jgi:archaeal flagellar protein FlaJ